MCGDESEVWSVWSVNGYDFYAWNKCSKEKFTITEMKPIKKWTNCNGPVSLLLKMKRKQKLGKTTQTKVKQLSHTTWAF